MSDSYLEEVFKTANLMDHVLPPEDWFGRLALIPPEDLDRDDRGAVSRWLSRSNALTAGVVTLGYPSGSELHEALRSREIVAGPFSRSFADGQTQHYAYVRD